MECILIHGQGRSSLSMRVLGLRLRRAGHGVHYFDYFVHRETFDQIVARLVNWIKADFADQAYVLIGHSLGGIIARASLPLLPDHEPQHLIMLAPPNRSPLLAQYLKDNPIYRALTTDSGSRLANPDFYADLPLPHVPTTIFAGTLGLRGRLSPWNDEPNDAVVSVRETLLTDDYPVILVPSIHTFIMNSPIVWEHIKRILASVDSKR